MTDKELFRQALEALEFHVKNADEIEKIDLVLVTALRERLAQPEQEPVAKAWDEGYRQGVQDERISEANIGIAGFGAKVEPARQNPYGTTPPQRKPEQEPVANIRIWHKNGEQHAELWNWDKGIETLPDGDHDLYTATPQRKPLTHPQIHEFDWPDGVSFEEILLFARAIEAAHGIKGEA